MEYPEAQSGGALRSLFCPTPPPWLHDRIAAVIRAEASRQHRRRVRRYAILGLATLLSLIAMAHGTVH
jgi:hypothetical protein